MEKPEHYDLGVFYCEVCGVRESPKKTAPESAMNCWINQRIASNLNSVGIKYPKKFLAKALGLSFIPCVARNNIFLNFGNET
jgi:hypothetical protein